MDLGALTVSAYLSPILVTVDAESSGRLTFFTLVMTWYLLSPALLIAAIVCSVISSMLYVCGPEPSARQKHAIVWSRVAWFVLLTVKGKNVNTRKEFTVLMDNHNRITRDSKDNQMALEHLKELVGL